MTLPATPAGAAADPVPAARYWPLRELRLRAGDLELRLPGESDLAALAADGVHDPAVQPFTVP